MKISLNGKEIFSLSETDKKIIKNDIHSEIFESDMVRRIKYILTHFCDAFFKDSPMTALDSIPGDFPNDSIEVDGKVAFILPSKYRKYFMYISPERNPEDIIKDRIEWILMHKVERCFARMVSEWKTRIGPSLEGKSKTEAAQIIFSKDGYKDRSQREQEDLLRL